MLFTNKLVQKTSCTETPLIISWYNYETSVCRIQINTLCRFCPIPTMSATACFFSKEAERFFNNVSSCYE